jgi:DNA recombination protein RmuC
MNSAFIALAVAVVAALAALVWAVLERGRASRAEQRAWALGAAAAEDKARLKMLEEQAAAQGEFLRAQAAQQASAVADELVKRADEAFKSRELLAQARIEAQLKPVAETLAKVQEQTAAAEKARAEEAGGLKAQIAQMLAASTATQDEARKLSAVLRRGAGVQGRWGEQTLRNVLEQAGLNNRYDFAEQVSTDTEEGRRRPDATIRLPGGGVFVIDAKCSLNAFLDAQDAADEALRDACLIRHAQSVRAHMQGLSAKSYWDQFESSPDFVAMFVPGDSILSAALERAPDLMSEGMDRRVVIVTPTTLFALCKAVAYGWRGEEQALNARRIAELGRELYKRLSVMGAHANAAGRSLEQAVGHYNKMVGSLETQVIVQARRFEDLKVDHEGRELAVLGPIETAVRPITKLSTNPEPQIRMVAGDES